MMIFKGWTAAVAPLLVVAPGVGHAVTEANFAASTTGAIGGNAGPEAAVGAGAGLLGGLVVDQQRPAEDTAFQQEVTAGRRSASQ
jgi:hypothetical protein